jgi:hypothetical protein
LVRIQPSITYRIAVDPALSQSSCFAAGKFGMTEVSVASMASKWRKGLFEPLIAAAARPNRLKRLGFNSCLQKQAKVLKLRT